MTSKSQGCLRIAVITVPCFWRFSGRAFLRAFSQLEFAAAIYFLLRLPFWIFFQKWYRTDDIQHHTTINKLIQSLKALLALSSNSNKTNLKPIALPSISSLGFDIV